MRLSSRLIRLAWRSPWSAIAVVTGAAAGVGVARLTRRIWRSGVERALEEELAAVIDAMGEGVTVADRLGRIVLINKAGRAIFGIGPPPFGPETTEEYHALHLRLLSGEPLGEAEWPITRALRGERFQGYEVILDRADGAVRQVVFSGGAVRDKSGRVTLGVTVYHDVTDLRALERSREELLGLVSHDLRAPLAVIQGRAEILLRRRGEDPVVARNAQVIQTSTRRMNAIIQDLIELPGLESGQVPLRKQPVRLPGYLRELVDRLLPPDERGRIRVDAPGDLPEVPADPDRLERVLTNLLTNALKYSRAGTPVVVSARQQDDEVVVSVGDEGPGLASDELPHLFDRYYRARTGLHVEGVGLGLYISKQIVEAHGGQIWVESQPGVGSTFRFSLPLGGEARPMPGSREAA